MRGACSYQAKALPLSPWVDESLPFTISLPENWELVALASDDNTQYRIAPDDYSEDDESFRVYFYFLKPSLKPAMKFWKRVPKNLKTGWTS